MFRVIRFSRAVSTRRRRETAGNGSEERTRESETSDNGNSAIVLAASMVCRNSGDNEGVTEVTNVTPVFIDFESLAVSKEDA